MENNKIKKIKKRIFFEKKFIHFVNVEIHPRLRYMKFVNTGTAGYWSPTENPFNKQ
jgi:hypothetical protein